MNLKYLFFAFSQLFCTVNAFDTIQSNIGVWLSGAAYCNKENYKTMKLAGPATGFLVADVIYDKATDMQGFTGVLEKQSTIYVAFRGSSSLLNWMDDFEIRLVPYETFPECNCKVHNGFNRVTNGVIVQTISSVNKLLKKYPSFKIVSVGHSLAAGVSLLVSMELLSFGIQSSVYNYGQPRTGNDNFAVFVNEKLPNYWRFTHNKDMVVHVPPKTLKYHHSCGEIFEDENGKIKTCSNTNCEDPTCSMKYSLIETNAKDHMVYLNHTLSCEDSTIL